MCCCAGIVIEPLFNAFATTAFFEFVVFAIFEMRYLLSVWRARRANALDPWAAQRELSVLYARFYGALLGGIFLMYQLQGCATCHPGQHQPFPAIARMLGHQDMCSRGPGKADCPHSRSWSLHSMGNLGWGPASTACELLLQLLICMSLSNPLSCGMAAQVHEVPGVPHVQLLGASDPVLRVP